MNNTGTKQVSIMKKLHFEEKNGEYRACLKYSVPIFVEYIKCNVWRLAVRYDSHIGVVKRQTVNINQLDAINFIMILFQASTCFEHKCSSSEGQNCTMRPLVSSH